MFDLLLNRKAPKLSRLVVGINQVDKMCPDGWDERLNMPVEAADKEIEKRSKDIIKKLSRYADISTANMEYYSALKRYRLLHLLGKIVRYSYAGFKLDQVEPRPWYELAAPDVQDFARQEIERRQQQRAQQKGRVSPKAMLMDELHRLLSPDEFEELREKLRAERRRPPKVAILGKTQVGKTTTVNNVFNADWKTSHTVVGTTRAQVKEFELATGGSLTVVDLPGYGRTLAEDREYERIYRDVLPGCDLILLIIQANARDFADDQEMLEKIKGWLRAAPEPHRRPQT